MVRDSDLTDTEREIRRATVLKTKAEAGAEDLTEDDIADLYQLVEERCDSWEVTYSALDALNATAKNRPALLAGIVPRLIQQQLALPSEYDGEAFALEDVSTTPEIGRPVYTSWILHNVAEQDPAVLLPHTNTLTELYRDDTTQPRYVLLALGRLAVADPDRLPVGSIRTDLQELSNGDGWYGARAQELLDQIE